MDISEGRLKADHLEVDFDTKTERKEPQKIKLYNKATFSQKLQLCLIVLLSLASLISNLTSIALLLDNFSIAIQLGNVRQSSEADIPWAQRPGELGGVDWLLLLFKQLYCPNVTRQTVEKYLKSEQAYTLHKPARRRFTKNHTYVAGIDAQWQADLTDMQGIAWQNGEMRYLLIVIDVFSNFALAIPVHSKDAKAITAALRQML